MCDNAAVVSVLNTGRSKCPLLLQCIREIAFLSATGGFWIRSQHVPGLENRQSDFLSRWSMDPSYEQRFWEEVEGVDVQEVEVHPDLFIFNSDW